MPLKVRLLNNARMNMWCFESHVEKRVDEYHESFFHFYAP